MSDSPEDRPRPTPRPRGATARPSPTPRPRVAGSRREREEADEAAARTPRPAPTPTPRPRPAPRGARAAAPTSGGRAKPAPTTATTAGAGSGKAASATATQPAPKRSATRSATRAARAAAPAATAPRRGSSLVLVLALLCVLAAAGGGFLLWQRLSPAYVNSAVFSATRANVEALYAYDYKDNDGSIRRKLDALTGDLRDQYSKDLKQGGIVDTYQQVSATTSFVVADVGLQQINDAQDSATLVVFGKNVVKSVNSGNQPAPQGSGCEVTPQGEQACTQTLQVHAIKVGGTWKISELTVLTTS